MSPVRTPRLSAGACPAEVAGLAGSQLCVCHLGAPARHRAQNPSLRHSLTHSLAHPFGHHPRSQGSLRTPLPLSEAWERGTFWNVPQPLKWGALHPG